MILGVSRPAIIPYSRFSRPNYRRKTHLKSFASMHRQWCPKACRSTDGLIKGGVLGLPAWQVVVCFIKPSMTKDFLVCFFLISETTNSCIYRLHQINDGEGDDEIHACMSNSSRCTSVCLYDVASACDSSRHGLA